MNKVALPRLHRHLHPQAQAVRLIRTPTRRKIQAPRRKENNELHDIWCNFVFVWILLYLRTSYLNIFTHH